MDDVQCYATVRELRWPEGRECPFCTSKKVIIPFLLSCDRTKCPFHFLLANVKAGGRETGKSKRRNSEKLFANE
ncbi:transposase [Desulforhopalus vacuolatus]|uniref:transposase n=1 Tax=Desulforhopalus vacuolatus TaxID=40414 RepID=UPI001F06C0AC